MSFFSEFFGSGQSESINPASPHKHEPNWTSSAEAPPDPNIQFDPIKVLEAAGVKADRRDYVNRSQDLIQSLPLETSATTKRQIVEASFRAFEVPLAQILDAAEAEIATYELFISDSKEHMASRRERGEARIAELEAEVARLRENLRLHEVKQHSLAESAKTEIARIQTVLDFFDAGVEEPPTT